MSVCIRRPEDHRLYTYFSELSTGDHFEYEGELWIKIGDSSHEPNIVSLETGSSRRLLESAGVIICAVSITYNYGYSGDKDEKQGTTTQN